MKIGEFAKRAGVSTSKVRFYEDRGLLPPSMRSENGYRSFGPADLERLTRVQRAQALGFSLEQIAWFFSRPERERHDKTAVIEAAELKLAKLDLHLTEVRAQRQQIAAFLAELRAEQAGPKRTAPSS